MRYPRVRIGDRAFWVEENEWQVSQASDKKINGTFDSWKGHDPVVELYPTNILLSRVVTLHLLCALLLLYCLIFLVIWMCDVSLNSPQ
eukprot:Gb_10566 [translate_table: standard]